jgi:hypothetical protein
VIRKATTILMMGAALSLCAEDVRFGVQGGLTLPAADLSDNASIGIQAGGHAKWNIRDGHGLMPRADLNIFGQSNGTNVTGLSLACDYTYHVDRRPTGFYVLAGLNESTFHTSFRNRSSNDTSLGIDLGAGFDLDRHLGFQGRYTTNSFNSVTYGALNVNVTYTF